MFNIQIPNEGLNEIYDEINNILYALGDEGISQNDLALWKEHVVQEYMVVYNNPIAFSRVVLKYLNSGFNLTLMEDELENLNATTIDDYKRIAQKYFNPDNFKVIMIGNIDSEPVDFTQRFEGLEYVDVYGQGITKSSDPVENVESSSESEIVD